jgi:F-type H+-transporting ATPase subunit epsilon
MTKLHFELVSPEKLVASRDVHMVVVPGVEGDFGVLAGHAPMMSTIRDGELAIYAEAGAAPEMLTLRGGFAEVSDKGLTILAESVG